MFEINRRAVLAGGSSLAAMATLGGCEKLFEKIANRPVRKDIATLAANDPVLQAYRDAVAQMQGLPAGDPRNWTKQAEIHLNTCPHGNWFFLPWHRAYLIALDDIVRTLTGDANFSMPYWNWTCQRSVPPPFWQAGSVLNYSPRSATSSSQASTAVVGTSNMNTILAETDFQLFASGAATALRGGGGFQGALEQGPHNYIHGFVGGTMGTYMSPLDPIFWLHHCNIDRVWFDWNSAGNANTSDPVYTNFQLNNLFVDGNGQPMDFQVGSLVLAPLITYRYAAPQGCAFNITRLDEAALRKLLETGAPHRFEVRRELQPLTSGLTISGRGKRLSQLTLPAGFATAALQEAEANRFVLRLDDARPNTNQENAFLQIYVDLPEGETPSPDSPYYAGAVAFFIDGEHNHGPVINMVDLTATIERLTKDRRIDPAKDLNITFELVPIRDDAAAKAAILQSSVSVGAVVPQLIARTAGGEAKRENGAQ